MHVLSTAPSIHRHVGSYAKPLGRATYNAKPAALALQQRHTYPQVRLVLEYCDRGCLRDALDRGAFRLPDGSVNYAAVLDTAVEVGQAVAHLHRRNVLHSDLKVRRPACGRPPLAVASCVPPRRL